MCHWKKWIWPGLLTIAALSLLALWMKTDFIQNDLTAKATSALSSKGHSWASVKMDGRDATISGNAPSEEAQTEAALLTDGAYEVRVVDNQTGLLVAQSPYILKAIRDGEAVELTGFIPNETMRGTIVASAKEALPGAKITDSMTLARGAPAGLAAIAGFGFTQLSGLTKGEMGLSDTDLSVSGASKDRETYNAINTALDGTLPGGAKLALKNITAPLVKPYTWAAKYNGSKVTLSGFVPSMDAAKSVADAAKAALPGVKIEDNQVVATGAPEGFGKATGYALQQLPRFTSGQVGLSDLALSVTGVAKSSTNYSAALGAVGASALPAGLALANANIVPSTVSPYIWGADYDGSNVTMSGFIPDDKTRVSVTSAVKKALPNAAIKDDMQIAKGAPDNFVNAARFGSNQLSRFAHGSVSLSNLALAVKGTALTSQSFKAANIAVSSGLPAGMTLASSNIIPPNVSPYTWGAEYNGSNVKLSGFVPNEEARSSIIAGTKKALPNAVISDAMEIADGAPNGFINAARFGSNQLSRFSSGSVALSDRALAVKGVAKSSEAFKAANIAISSGLPADMTLASKNIVPPTITPYSWGADYDGKTVTLNGFVPSDEARAKIVKVTKGKLPGAKVVDLMQTAAGAPTSFDDATAGAISILPRFSKGDVALSGLNLTINGVGKSSPEYLSAKTYAGGDLPGNVNLVTANIQPPASQGNYMWQAEREGDKVTLSGSVPSVDVRSKIAVRAGALYSGSTIDNQMVIESGAPESFRGNTDLALDLLEGLREGTAKLTNETLTVDGTARTVNSYDETIEAKASLGGVIWPPIVSPFTWSIDKGADKALMNGFVPNRGQGNANVATAKDVLKKPVEDSQRIGGGAPIFFGNAVSTLIAGVERLDNSSANIIGNNVFLQGRADSEEEATLIGAEVGAALPKNYKYRHRISYPLPKPAPVVVLQKEFVPEPIPDPAPVVVLQKEYVPEPVPEPSAPVKICLVNFPALFAGEKIKFDTARAIIKDESFPLLDRIAGGLKECDKSIIEVGGHTDSRGSEGYNQGLSEARAQAVMEYMTVKAGVKGSSLVAKGYGELQPIAPNTRAERFKNRRIEFKELGR